MSRIRVPYTGITTQRQTQQSLTDKQLGLVAKLAEDCDAWEKMQQWADSEELPPSSSRRRTGQEFVAGKFNSSIETELASEAGARKEGENRGMAAFREQLPAFDMREELLTAVRGHQVVVVSGETGCGKTTQVRIFVLWWFVDYVLKACACCPVTTFGQVPQYLLDEAVRSGSGSKVMN